MTLLIIGLSLLSLLAIGFVLWPLLVSSSQANVVVEDRSRENVRSFKEYMVELNRQKDEGRITADEYASLKLEKERLLLDDVANKEALALNASGGRVILPVVAVAVLLAAFGLYQHFGALNDVAIQELTQQKRDGLIRDLSANRVADPAPTLAVIERLKSSLQKDPTNTQYQFMLARNYTEIDEFGLAVAAFDKLIEQDQSSSIVYAEAAQALFLEHKQQINDKLVAYVDKSLALDANNVVALGLSGIIGFTRADYPRAIAAWTKVLELSSPNSPSAPSIRAGIERAQVLMAQQGQQPVVANKGIEIPVQILLKDGIDVKAGSQVFIYARAWQGGRMPLAITKLPYEGLPKSIVLTESMAMSPAATLKTVSQVEVVVRISATGSATPEPGDWEGSFGPIDIGQIPEIVTVTVVNRL